MRDTPRLQRKLGKAVRRLRTALGYSQESFADAVGMHRTHMGEIERGESNPTLETLVRLAKQLKLPVSALLAEAEGEGRRPPAVPETRAAAP